MHDIQEFKEKGYVFFGYISPELSSHETYPEYIKECVDETVDKVQKIQNRNTITFGMMADMHYSHNHNHNIRATRTVNAYREISKRVHSERLIAAGDFVNDGCIPYKTLGYRELRAHLSDFNYLPVNGNHDDNSIWDKYLQSDKITSRLQMEQVYNLFFNHLPSLGAVFDSSNPGLYYYIDDKVKKIRYIFLDVCDFPISCFNTWNMYMAMSQNQINWLINSALQVEEDTDIIITAHSFTLPLRIKEGIAGDNGDDRIRYIYDILDAYKCGEKIKKSFGSGDFEVIVDADFTKIKRGNIIGCFAGHYHADIIEQSEAGIPYIYVANFMMYNQTGHVERIDGEKSEILFDIVTIDRRTKVIYLTRVGAGKDRSIQY